MTIAFLCNFAVFAQDKNIIQLKNDIKICSNQIQKVKLFSDLSEEYYKIKKYDSAIIYIDNAIKISDNLKNEIQKVDLLNKKGNILQSSNNFAKSIITFETALEFATANNDSLMMCVILNGIGVSYRRIDDDGQAFLHHQQALEIARKISNSKNIAIALNSLGIIHANESKFKEAAIFFEKALKTEYSSKNLKGQAINLNSLAWVYTELKDYNKAIEFYKKSINKNIENKDSFGIHICYKDIGETYGYMGKYELASEYLEKAQQYFDKVGNIRYSAQNILVNAKVKFLMNEHIIAKLLARKSAKLADSISSIKLKYKSFLLLYEIYKKNNDFKNALESYETAFSLKDSIESEKVKKIVEVFQVKSDLKETIQKLDVSKKQNALNKKIITRQRIIGAFVILFIILLAIMFFIVRRNNKGITIAKKILEDRNAEIQEQKHKIEIQNGLLEKQKNELEKNNAAKDKFFSIIAHDLRNPFNSLIGFSALLVNDFETISDKEKIEMLNLMNSSAVHSYKMLEDLLAWAKTQTGNLTLKRETFELNNFIDDIIENYKLRAKQKKIKIINNVDENLQINADKNMINTVFRNLISNALKFTYENGSIKIYSKSENNSFVNIFVSDTGMGISKENIEKIFEIDETYVRKGTDKEKGSGLGLILCKEFIEKHRGKISVESEPEKGSVFKFSLPLLKN